MQIKELKQIIADMPEDADIVMQKMMPDNHILVAPVISYRYTRTRDKKHARLLLCNMNGNVK